MENFIFAFKIQWISCLRNYFRKIPTRHIGLFFSLSELKMKSNKGNLKVLDELFLPAQKEKKGKKLAPVKKVKSQNLKSDIYEDLGDFDDFDPVMRKFR